MGKKTVKIDETKCDGCGLCVDACHEGAMEVIYGKAKLVKADVCDGLGDCLPVCPQDAIALVDAETGGEEHTCIMAKQGHQWPIQLGLIPIKSDFFNGPLAIASDCSAFVTDDFRKKVLKGMPVIVGCPKLDDSSRFEKLTEVLKNNDVKRLKIIRMEVPCCGALTKMVETAVRESGKDIEIEVVTISCSGLIM